MQRQYIESSAPRPILVTDTITILQPEDAGAVIVSGSHGGVSSAQFVLGRSLAGVFYNDAGIGKDKAGIAGLAILNKVGLPAAAVDHKSAMIGDGADAWRAGVISRANSAATVAGIRPGQWVEEAAGILARCPVVQTDGALASLNRQSRSFSGVDIALLDSISMLSPGEMGAVVVSGSHGGVASAEFAARFRPLLTVFNDAGIGKHAAGCAALDVLSRVQLAAVAVDFNSGRIGDPVDMLDFGIISRANTAAVRLGFAPDGALLDAVGALARHLHSQTTAAEQVRPK